MYGLNFLKVLIGLRKEHLPRNRHTIRPVLAGTIPVLRALSRSVNQNVPVRHSLCQDSPTQWRSEAKCHPGLDNKVPPFPHLKFAYNN